MYKNKEGGGKVTEIVRTIYLHDGVANEPPISLTIREEIKKFSVFLLYFLKQFFSNDSVLHITWLLHLALKHAHTDSYSSCLASRWWWRALRWAS